MNFDIDKDDDNINSCYWRWIYDDVDDDRNEYADDGHDIIAL